MYDMIYDMWYDMRYDMRYDMIWFIDHVYHCLYDDDDHPVNNIVNHHQHVTKIFEVKKVCAKLYVFLQHFIEWHTHMAKPS